jgi:drug/metabolite transporter (DMT)-like permease
MRVLNQYSFALIGVVIFIVAVAVILRRFDNPWRILLILIVAGVLVISWFSFRPQPGTKASRADILNQIGQGIPVLLEVQSQY